jgi:hypothetical protein
MFSIHRSAGRNNRLWANEPYVVIDVVVGGDVYNRDSMQWEGAKSFTTVLKLIVELPQ